MKYELPNNMKMKKKDEKKISNILNKLGFYFVIGILTGFLTLGILLLIYI